MPIPEAWRTVKTLWIGDSLELFEQLSLKSFLSCGHDVEIFTYGEVENIPAGANVRDANEIIPENEIFYYEDGKHRKGLGAFSNWFRYRMLNREGGIWVDTDIICLRGFDFSSDVFFGTESRNRRNRYNNAVIGVRKPGEELMDFMEKASENPNTPLPFESFREKRKKAVRKYLKGNRRGNVKFGETGPTGFTKAVRHLGHESDALPVRAFYPIHPQHWQQIFDESFPDIDRFFPDVYAIHLWNEMLRTDPAFDKNANFPDNSLIEALKRRFL